jgi:hypothetical protein
MPRGRTASPDKITLEAALVGLELKRNEIDALISKIKKQLGPKYSALSFASAAAAFSGPGGTATKGQGTPRKKRVLSPEARKRIAAAQKRRWAEHRKAQQA